MLRDKSRGSSCGSLIAQEINVFNFVPEAYDNDMVLNAISPLNQINKEKSL